MPTIKPRVSTRGESHDILRTNEVALRAAESAPLPAEPKCRGDSVVWRSSTRAWMGARQGRVCLIAMIDEASGQVLARFASGNSTQANLDVLGEYIRRFGRPLRFRTHRLSLFRGNPRLSGDAPRNHEAGESQIRRALAELEIEWSPTGSSRTDKTARFFGTAEKKLRAGLQESGAKTLRDANKYLQSVYLPSWRFRNEMKDPLRDVHRRVLAVQDLDSILSEVETRSVSAQSTVQFHGTTYGVPEHMNVPHGAAVQIERRADGDIYLRDGKRRLRLKEEPARIQAPSERKARRQLPNPRNHGFNRKWMQDFFKGPAPPLWRLLK